MVRKPILGLEIDLGPLNLFVDRIIASAKRRQSAYVCLANVHMTVEAYRHPSFAHVLAGADLVSPDGMPLVHALKWLHGVVQERVAGVDLLEAVLQAANDEGLGVFVYGETKTVHARLKEHIGAKYPRLHWSGAISPPFRALSENEKEVDLGIINASGAQMVLVSLGCPRQEKWMAGHKGRIDGVMIGLGAALAVYAGVQRRAPSWMRRCSLEWLYRFLQEPRRLGRRYLFTNTQFVLYLGRELFRKKFFR